MIVVAHERFHYKNLEELKARAQALGADLPFAADTRVLAEPVSFGPVTVPNRLGIAPDGGRRLAG